MYSVINYLRLPALAHTEKVCVRVRVCVREHREEGRGIRYYTCTVVQDVHKT